MNGSVRFNTIATVSLLSLTAIGLRFAEIRTPGSLALQLDSIPRTIGEWRSDSDRQLAPSIWETLKATSYLQRIYRRGRNELEFFVAYYAEQRAGESIHTPKHCLPGGGWEVAEVGTIAVPFRGMNVIVNSYVVQQGNERLRILYWYHSRSRIVANEYAAKLYLARDAISRGTTDGAIVKIVVVDQPRALEDALEFAEAILPHVQLCFGNDAAPVAFAK